MGMEEIEKQFGVTSTSEFEDQISERKLPEMAFVINEDGGSVKATTYTLQKK